jgi:hypothetical protein
MPVLCMAFLSTRLTRLSYGVHLSKMKISEECTFQAGELPKDIEFTIGSKASIETIPMVQWYQGTPEVIKTSSAIVLLSITTFRNSKACLYLGST